MGSNETATATTGGPRVIDVFSGDGCHRVQIIYFFRMRVGSRTPSRIGLGSGGPLDRMRKRLVLPRELWIEIFGKSCSSALERKGPVLIYPNRWKRSRMRYERLPTSSTDPRRLPGDPRTTPRQDSTDAAAMVGPSIPRHQEINFSPPSKCPIDLFGPVANRTVLNDCVLCPSLLVSYKA